MLNCEGLPEYNLHSAVSADVFLLGVQSESGSRMGEGRRRCHRGPWDGGAGGINPLQGNFHNQAGMVVRGGRRQSICQPALHMSQRSIFSSSNGL